MFQYLFFALMLWGILYFLRQMERQHPLAPRRDEPGRPQTPPLLRHLGIETLPDVWVEVHPFHGSPRWLAQRYTRMFQQAVQRVFPPLIRVRLIPPPRQPASGLRARLQHLLTPTPPPPPPLPKAMVTHPYCPDRTPSLLRIAGEVRAHDPLVRLTVTNHPPGWTALWRTVTRESPAPLPLVVIEPETLTLTYRPWERHDRQHLFWLLQGILNNTYFFLIPHMYRLLEALAQTAWAQRPENHPWVAFYQTLARISHGGEADLGWGDLWEPLAYYLDPPMVFPRPRPLPGVGPQRISPDLKAMMYNLRAFSASLQPYGWKLLTRAALDDLTRALALQPRWVGAYHLNRAAFLWRLGQGEAALAAYTQALQHEPDNPAALYGRAVIFYLLRRVADARRDVLLLFQHPSPCARSYREEILRLVKQMDSDFPLTQP